VIRTRLLVVVCVTLAFVSACAAPFAIKRNPLGAQRKAIANVIATGELSRRTQNLLYDHDLVARYAKDPTGAIALLHGEFVDGGIRPENVGALAELSFHHARSGGGRPYYLAAALYAWDYLFPADDSIRPDRLDPFVLLASEIYNRGVAAGFLDGDKVDLRSGTYPLPFGNLEVTLDEQSVLWNGHQLYDFFPLTDIEVTGFPTYYRWAGIGAPLAAKVIPNPKDVDLLGPRIRVPVTAVLRPADSLRTSGGVVHASLVAYPGYGDTKIDVHGHQIPLGAEPTATVGLGLAETALWKRELSVFLGGAGVITKKTQLVSLRPYRRGLIPVVFVHGTGSSAIRWAELYNEIDNDPRIHQRYQFWFFSYDSGNPIAYSASQLRGALEAAVAKLDPEGKDPALRRMIVMGHSQGGLLTRMLVVDSGDAFWRNISSKPFDEIKMSQETRDLLRPALFVHPLPFVERVVFVATPHHGSYVAGNWLAHQFARLISMPLSISKAVTDVVTLDAEARAVAKTRGSTTAVDNMTPGNPFIKTLSSLPIAPGVAVNSIIPVDADPPYPGKNDGVVEYDSAHIEPVESEVVVHSPHSCQSNPATMEEVRRILLRHLEVGADVSRGDSNK
jgi:pimeloyl-ACP methyl ester carboxylesterase